ncbi:predicted protein [Naegleria gruberi]|uniref:Predicted protein n=1 Tax=Naegleria gruberi TaxID=5762 RepID=D2VFL1_NAEGR|nr:uncharacterized protein NAEGRDRAFT_58058 [Naegleria gruberi]EFC44379.1 predicted protein [Naegleria gruberi]|eukprot:XP_002677123.1 predicted protein [Naegleria gruberi strain NEG-M]
MEYFNNLLSKTGKLAYGSRENVQLSGNQSTQALNRQTLELYSMEMADIAKESYELDFSKIPLNKNVVLVLGDQSAGKSSFVNYLFSGSSIRETGANAIDTQFTILECVSEKEFRNIVGISKYDNLMKEFNRKKRDPNFDIDEWKSQPLERQITDERENILYCELSQTDKMNRYRQFYDSTMKTVLIKHHELVKAYVVNARFIDGTDMEKMYQGNVQERKKQRKKEKELSEFVDNICTTTKKKEPAESEWELLDPKAIKKNNSQKNLEEDDGEKWLVENLIFIDTPGFNGSMNLDVEKFKANIEVLEFFYKNSSLVLFLLSPAHLLSIGNSLYMLQLTIIDQETREKLYKHVYSQLQITDNTLQNGNNVQQPTPSSGGLVSSISKTVLDTLLSGCYSALESNFKSITSLYSGGPKKQKDYYFGSSIYDKLYFVINKIDTVKNVNYCHFELGCSIGRNFKFLPLPTASRVLCIACPNEIRSQIASTSFIKRKDVNLANVNFGDLHQLEKIINTLRDEKQIQLTFINHIQYMFEKIQAKHQNMNYYNQYMLGTVYERAQNICNLCCDPTPDELRDEQSN